MRTLKDSIKLTVKLSAGLIAVTGSFAVAQIEGDQEAPNYQLAQSGRARTYAQPTTTVEASPLVESRAGNLRKARENAEVSTEQRIVEKLEESRLEDEKRRADRLFGNRLEEPVKEVPREEPKPVYVAPIPTPTPTPLPPPPQVQQQPAQPQVIVIQAPEYHEPVKEVKDERTSRYDDDGYEAAHYYVAGLLGSSQYSSVNNVQGNFAGGVSIGQIYRKGLILEGGFLFSNYNLNNYFYSNAYTNVDQYQFNFAAKYQFLRNHVWLHPFIGGVAAYTYRKYSEKGNYAYAVSDSSASSNSFDLGATFGADANLTDEFSVGADFRYMANVFAISNNSFIGDSNSQYYGYGATKPLEKVGYWTFLVTAKYHF